MKTKKNLCRRLCLFVFAFLLAFEPLSIAVAVEKDGYATDDYDFLEIRYDNLSLHPSDGSAQTAGQIYWSCSGKLENSGTAAYVSSWIDSGLMTFQALRLDVFKVEREYNAKTRQYEDRSQLVKTCFNNGYSNIRVVRFSENGSLVLSPGEYTFVLKATFSHRSFTICSHKLTVVNADDVKPQEKPKVTTKPNASTEKKWSSWSGWSTTPVSSSSTRQVETKVDTKTTSEKVYKYTRWKYYNTAYNTTYYSYAKYTGPSYKEGSGTWESKTTTKPLGKTKVISGHQQYSGYWYNESVTTKDATTTVTYYRYRDLISK